MNLSLLRRLVRDTAYGYAANGRRDLGSAPTLCTEEKNEAGSDNGAAVPRSKPESHLAREDSCTLSYPPPTADQLAGRPDRDRGVLQVTVNFNPDSKFLGLR